jgi:FAD/FMN-containing dehydrogenase
MGHMMKQALLILALVYAGAPALWCQDSSDPLTEPRESLRGLLGVSVETDHNGCRGIVDKDLTKQDIEVRLRVAGIRITPLPFVVLGMMANCLPIENSGRRVSTVIHFLLSVRQVVWLPPQPVRVALATTWESGNVLIFGAATKCDDYFRSQLKDHTDKFINDFLAMNPKQ